MLNEVLMLSTSVLTSSRFIGEGHHEKSNNSGPCGELSRKAASGPAFKCPLSNGVGLVIGGPVGEELCEK